MLTSNCFVLMLLCGCIASQSSKSDISIECTGDESAGECASPVPVAPALVQSSFQRSEVKENAGEMAEEAEENTEEKAQEAAENAEQNEKEKEENTEEKAEEAGENAKESDPPFKKGDELACPDGFVRIAKRDDCKKAASDLKYRNYAHVKVNVSSRPGGCYVAYGDQAYFNMYPNPNDPGNNGDIVCEKKGPDYKNMPKYCWNYRLRAITDAAECQKAANDLGINFDATENDQWSSPGCHTFTTKTRKFTLGVDIHHWPFEYHTYAVFNSHPKPESKHFSWSDKTTFICKA